VTFRGLKPSPCQRRSRTSNGVTAGALWLHALRRYEATAAISSSSRSSDGMP